MVASLEKTPDSGKALSLPLGVVSPLWMMFAGAATAGVAYWWMTRWTRPTNLEADLAPPQAPPELLVEPVMDLAQEAEVAVPEVRVVDSVPAADEPPLKLRRRNPKSVEAS